MKTIPARNGLGRPVTEEVREEAIARGLERSQWEPHAISVQYLEERSAIELEFDDFTAITLPLAKYPYLRDLTRQELSQLKVGFGGVALCLAERDLHVSIAGMVAASRSLTEVAVAVATATPVVDVSNLELYELDDLASQIYDHLTAHEEWEISYWTNTLGVPEEALVGALEQLRQSHRVNHVDEEDDVPEGHLGPA